MRVIVRLTAPDKPDHVRECAPYEVGSWLAFAERFHYSIELESTEAPCIDSLDLTSDLRRKLDALDVSALLNEPLAVRFVNSVSTFLRNSWKLLRRTVT